MPSIGICDYARTPRADRELCQFRCLGERGKLVTGSFHYHYARLIKILFCLEKIEEVLEDPDITSGHVCSNARVNQLKGIGVSEAPRGTLFHEYEVDENGIFQNVDLIIATGQNNLTMNRTVKQIAKSYVNGSGLSEGILNHIEHSIRTYDPCLICFTHAVGQMPLHVQPLAPTIAAEEISAVVFVDTRVALPSEIEPAVQIRTLTTDTSSPSLGHHLTLETLLVYARMLYGQQPATWLVTVPGLNFDLASLWSS